VLHIRSRHAWFKVPVLVRLLTRLYRRVALSHIPISIPRSPTRTAYSISTPVPRASSCLFRRQTIRRLLQIPSLLLQSLEGLTSRPVRVVQVVGHSIRSSSPSHVRSVEIIHVSSSFAISPTVEVTESTGSLLGLDDSGLQCGCTLVDCL
jgi:hypothetical protein